MKKNLLLLLVFVALFATACSMNVSNPKSSTYIQKASVNTDKLMNAGFMDVEKAFGVPHSSVYYINTENLKGKDMNTLTMDDLRNSVTIESAYEVDKNKDSYLHVYYENGKVNEIVTGNYNLFNSERFNKNEAVASSNYKIEFYKNQGAICENDFTIENARKDFIGANIADFNKSYLVNSANFVASKVNGTEKLYFYPLVPHDIHPDKQHKHPHYASNHVTKDSIVNPVNNNISYTSQTDNKDLGDYATSAVLIHTKNGIIENMEIVNNDMIKGLIGKVIEK